MKNKIPVNPTCFQELDYHNIETLSSSWLRSQVGVVSSSSPQATDFFNETIADNIRHGTSNAVRIFSTWLLSSYIIGIFGNCIWRGFLFFYFFASRSVLPMWFGQPRLPGCTPSSPPSRSATKQRLGKGEASSLKARSKGCYWPGPCSTSQRSWFWTRLCRPWRKRMKRWEKGLKIGHFACSFHDQHLFSLKIKVANQGVTDALPNSTCIIATHRLSTIKDLVDHIFVMDGGKVVEGGTHQDLVGMESGMYHHLWAYRWFSPQTPNLKKYY